MASFLFKFFFLVDKFFFKNGINAYRKFVLKCRGIAVGKGTFISSCYFTWPHKVLIGRNCVFEKNVYFKHDGPYSLGRSISIGDNVFVGKDTEFNIRKNINIGNNCLIASGCKFVDHDHGIGLSQLMRVQECVEKEIIIEDDVWLGANVVVLKGVIIKKGAIIAAGAVVTKLVGESEIWGGVPAKKIGMRV